MPRAHHLYRMERGPDTIEIVLSEQHIGMRFDRALADTVPSLSRERIRALLDEGKVTIAGAPAIPRASARVGSPMTLTMIIPEARPATAAAQDIPLTIAYEDDHLIVVDKAAGMVVHPASGNVDGTLVNALLHHCAGQLSGIGGVARPGIVHRIDKDTSGLIVAAKTNAAHEGLAKQFFDHSIERIYQCIVNGVPIPPAGTIDAALARSPYDRKKIAITTGARGKHAVTHFRMIQALNNAALVECRLETGRTHQVRVHMAHKGHSLIGDPVYGHSARHAALLKALGFKRQALHAAKLGFIHPITGQTVTCQSQMPNDMQDLFTRLTL